MKRSNKARRHDRRSRRPGGLKILGKLYAQVYTEFRAAWRAWRAANSDQASLHIAAAGMHFYRAQQSLRQLGRPNQRRAP